LLFCSSSFPNKVNFRLVHPSALLRIVSRENQHEEQRKYAADSKKNECHPPTVVPDDKRKQRDGGNGSDLRAYDPGGIRSSLFFCGKPVPAERGLHRPMKTFSHSQGKPRTDEYEKCGRKPAY
jgi:hypothetical protein